MSTARFTFTPTGWPHLDLQLTKASEHLPTLSPDRQAIWLGNWIEDIRNAKLSMQFNAFHQSVMMMALEAWAEKLSQSEDVHA